MSRSLILSRHLATNDRTLGDLAVYEGILRLGPMFATLELPWQDNKRFISCIPSGEYEVAWEHNGKYGDYLRLAHVSGRDGILLHVGNYPKNSTGCILLGMKHADLDKDGLFDVSQSRAAFDLLKQLVPGPTAKLFVFDAIEK